MKGMQKYCVNCPKFVMDWRRNDESNREDEYWIGRLNGGCLNWVGHYDELDGAVLPANDKICKRMKRKWKIGFRFTASNVPEPIREKFEEYVSSRECPISSGNKRCEMYVERLLEKLSK